MLKCLYEDGHETSLRHIVADTLVLKDGQILLVKRAVGVLEGGKWGLIGGFAERDETIKETVAREVLEETGYQVKDITLLTIRDNPNRRNEDRQNVAFVYFCTATEKVGKPDQESSAQQWFPLEVLPSEEEFAFDHFKNIELYLQAKKENLLLPIL